MDPKDPATYADVFQREVEMLRREVRELTSVTRELQSQQFEQATLVREEVLRILRDELSKGLSAQHMLTIAQSASLAELHSSSSLHEGRLAALERTWNQGEMTQISRSQDYEARLMNLQATAHAKLAVLSDELNELKVSAQRARAREQETHEELERLKGLLGALSNNSSEKLRDVADKQVFDE